MAELDALILEDQPIDQIIIKSLIPDGISYKLVETSSEFKKFLGRNKARLYFLDDNVPPKPGYNGERSFQTNHQYLIKKHPDARVFYTGSVPFDDTLRYLTKNRIEMIEKHQIGDIIKRELSGI